MVNVITKKIYTTTTAEDEITKDYIQNHPEEGVINRHVGAMNMDKTYSLVELTFGYPLDENRTTPGQYWDRWVGSQTPAEFISYNSEDQTNEEAISDYVDETVKQFDDNKDNLDEVKKGLLKYLEESIKEEENPEEEEEEINLTVIMPISLRDKFKKKCMDENSEMSYAIRKNIKDMLEGKIPIPKKPKKSKKKK